jgi:hypothetical protein
MTSSTLPLPDRRPHTARRADPLLAALLAAAVAGLAALVLASPGHRQSPPPRTAIVIDAGADSRAAVASARALAGSDAAVRVPRTAAEAEVDLRYLAAAGFGRIVVAGPVARTEARRVAPDAPRALFVTR